MTWPFSVREWLAGIARRGGPPPAPPAPPAVVAVHAVGDAPAMHGSAPAMHGGTADARFAACLAAVFGHEGGYVNDPDDNGGPTNMGITQVTLSAWRGRPVTAAEVKALSRAEAVRIYRARYWDRMRCGDLPPGIDLMVVDLGVNGGVGRGAEMLQANLGVAMDRVIGPRTIAAARAADPVALIERMTRWKEEFYRGLDDFPHFGDGWLARAARVERQALAMARGG